MHKLRLRHHPRFSSRYLSTRRDLIVYLPPEYEQGHGRYPVLYMQDGQNLFDASTAFLGQEWALDRVADEEIRHGRAAPMIIVGIYNTGVRRISEYTPTRDRKLRKGGKADRYAQMLAREIKPFIDSEYRTQKAAAHTGVGGSSLGGLVSLVAGLEYPRVFGKLAILSPSVWWDGQAILRSVESFRSRVHPRIWLDTGTREGVDPQAVVQDCRALRDALVARGWLEGENLCYREFAGAGHDEAAWRHRMGQVLRWLYPVAPRELS